LILERAEHPDWLSNAYLIASEPGGTGVLVDSNEVTEPLTDRVNKDGIEITHVLLTHHHWDHVVGAEKLAERYGVPVVAHELTAKALGGDVVTETFTDGDVVESGELRIRAIHTPGHCADHTALLIGDSDCLTADVLFRGTVGGTMAPGATGFADLKSSIMDKLMELPPETRIHPGHTVPSTIGEEWEDNPFIRIWRGLDGEGTDRCTVGPPDADERREATLVVWASDYDGGNKAWVRFEDDGEDAVVGGSQVRREA
jgi:glyoxylase-like metal-dependent hydrolase (beta-lactamase superfamily II)